jgi:hypothetical protein
LLEKNVLMTVFFFSSEMVILIAKYLDNCVKKFNFSVHGCLVASTASLLAIFSLTQY